MLVSTQRGFRSKLIRSCLNTIGVSVVGAQMILMAGCRQDMHNQPKIIPQRGSDFVGFPDHRSARPQVENTVARGGIDHESYFYTGVVMGANGYREEKNELPFPVSLTVLRKGQERFNIYCTPCHSRVGNGLGEIVQRGYKPAGNLNDEVRRAQPLSHYFYVMTHGYGAMPDYSAQLTPEERWAVAAYIRALQLSQNATASDVPSGAKVEALRDLAVAKGLPEGFAGPWESPAATAIEAYPPEKSEGMPGMGPAYPPDPKVFIPHASQPSGGKPSGDPAKKANTAKSTTAGILNNGLEDSQRETRLQATGTPAPRRMTALKAKQTPSPADTQAATEGAR